MANYTNEERGRMASVLHNILQQSDVQQELAKNVAFYLGKMLEPMVQEEVREQLRKMEVKF